MTMTELMPLLRQLNRAEKLHVMQCLVSDFAQVESDLLRQDMSYPISIFTSKWTVSHFS
jgi:hypothetical protein